MTTHDLSDAEIDEISERVSEAARTGEWAVTIDIPMWWVAKICAHEIGAAAIQNLSRDNITWALQQYAVRRVLGRPPETDMEAWLRAIETAEWDDHGGSTTP